MESKPEEPVMAAEEAGDAPTVPKPRLRKPVKPDTEEHKAAVEQLQSELNKRKARVEELKQLIDQKRQAGSVSPEVQQARAKLNGLSSSWKAELEKKTAFRAELNNLNKARDALRARIRELKGKVGAYATVQKIDERIAGLDYRITHHTMDLKEENRTRDEMKKLAALKPTVATFLEESEKLKASDRAREQFLSSLKACDEQITGIKAEEEKQRAKLDELRKKDSAKSQDIPSLAKERDECREVMSALWQKIQEMRAENKARHQQYWDEYQAWQLQFQEEKRQKQLAWEKEKAAKEAERKAAAAEFAGEPYHKEIGLCEQLISHLGKYRQQAEAQNAAPAPTAAVDTSGFEGMKALKKKGEDDDDSFGGLSSGKGGKKSKGKKGKAVVSTQAAPTDQKLNHSLDLINAFSTLKVSMPTTSSKVPEALEEVEQRKAYWVKKRAEAKETGVLASEEPEASSSAAPAKASQANGISKPKANGLLNFSAEEWPDFSGNVSKAPVKAPAKASTATTSAPTATDGPVSVKIGVFGDKVTLICTALS